MGVLTLAAYLIALAWTGISDDSVPDVQDLAIAWRSIGDNIRKYLGPGFFVLSFVGLWLGAASHTFTDMAGSFVKSGKITKFL